MLRKYSVWVFWIILTAALSVYLIVQLLSDDKSAFLPGKTSDGHYQIELACGACHADAFDGGEVLQDACMKCHGSELKIADDSHPKSKFTDPRNANRVAKLDARVCVTCHVEHKAEITHNMGVTLPENFCVKCHHDIAEDRPSHAGMGFDTCAAGGCHNFHDNRALYEDFIAKHLDEPDTLQTAVTVPYATIEAYTSRNDYPLSDYPVRELTVKDVDAPVVINDEKIRRDWLETRHNKAGINCGDCHQQTDKNNNRVWLDRPGAGSCAICHKQETDGYESGKHGMRLAQALPPMQPSLARAPMRKIAYEKQLTCVTCHAAHRFDTRQAQVDACLGCHDDRHSRNYKNSRHYDLWINATVNGKENTGVSCATCHMPREVHRSGKHPVALAQHNQNDNLRPNEKMIRSVCMNCHGLGFSINSLADSELVQENFSSKPSKIIQSMQMVRERVKQNAGKKGMN